MEYLIKEFVYADFSYYCVCNSLIRNDKRLILKVSVQATLHCSFFPLAHESKLLKRSFAGLAC